MERMENMYEALPDATEQFFGISSKLEGMPSDVADYVV
jgi:hypothetical protein